MAHPEKASECGLCSCRTINLAKSLKITKPDMKIYDKCDPPCPRPIPVPELPLTPQCIRVWTKEELLRDKCAKKAPAVKVPRTHGKIMWLVKTGVFVGAVYFTSTQGLWGDQPTAVECIDRWAAYLNAMRTKVPPEFDCNGKLVKVDTGDVTFCSVMYGFYKGVITTCFTGMVELPKIAMCSYTKYLKQKELREAEEKNKQKH